MKIIMIVLVITGSGVAGGLLGYYGKCTSGACPLTANPLRGSIIGLLLGGLFAVSLFGNPRTGKADGKSAKDVNAKDSAVVHIFGEEDFKQIILDAGKPALVDFYADWCPPCRALAPHVESLARKRPDMVIAKIDVEADKNKELARKYRVQSIPRLMLVKDGKEIAVKSGYVNEEDLNQWVNKELGE